MVAQVSHASHIEFTRNAKRTIRETMPEIISKFPRRSTNASTVAFYLYGKDLSTRQRGPRGRDGQGNIPAVVNQKERTSATMVQATWRDTVAVEDEFKSAISERSQMMMEMGADIGNQMTDYLFDQLDERHLHNVDWSDADITGSNSKSPTYAIRKTLDSMQKYDSGIGLFGLVRPEVVNFWKANDENFISVDYRNTKVLGEGTASRMFPYWGVNWMMTSLLPGSGFSNDSDDAKMFIFAPQCCDWVDGIISTDSGITKDGHQQYYLSTIKEFCFRVVDPRGVAAIDYHTSVVESAESS